MAQDLTVNIKTTSDVPQAMDKAKAATGSFDKQVGDIGMKFKTAFKDIALGFVAPMIILQGAISMISSAIEKAKQDAKEGLDLIAKGDTVFATSQEAKLAQFLKVKAATEEEQRLVKKGREEMTERFLTQTTRGKEVMQQMEVDAAAGNAGEYVVPSPKQLSQQKAMQDMALKEFLNSEEGKKYQPIFEDKQKAGAFKGPEGFGTVVGVGANPVMEAMTRQTEVLEEIKAVLEASRPSGGGVPVPFTEGPASTRREFTT